MFRSFSYLFLFSSQSRQIPPVMCRQVPDQDHYYRSDHHGRHSAPQPVYPNTGNGPYNRRTGINMAHKNIWRNSCHHITDQAASNSCDSPKKYKKKCSFHIPLGNPFINPHDSKHSHISIRKLTHMQISDGYSTVTTPAANRITGITPPKAPASSTSLQIQYRTSRLPQWYTADPETFPAARFPG